MVTVTVLTAGPWSWLTTYTEVTLDEAGRLQFYDTSHTATKLVVVIEFPMVLGNPD